MFLKGLQTNGHGNWNLIMKRMSNTLLINIFAWSILGGLLHVCQIVIHLDVLLFYRIVILCFGPWFLWIYEECFGPWRYCSFSCGILQLLQVGTCWGLERGHTEPRRNVLLEWPGLLSLWSGSGTRVWSFEILQGIAEGPIVFGRMKDASVLYFDARMSG